MLPFKRPAPLPLSEASARLPELLDQVIRHPGQTVLVDSRDQKERAVLVDATYYEFLLIKASVADRQPGEPFRLAGSIKINCPDQELEERIAENRRRQAELAAAKLKDL